MHTVYHTEKNGLRYKVNVYLDKDGKLEDVFIPGVRHDTNITKALKDEEKLTLQKKAFAKQQKEQPTVQALGRNDSLPHMVGDPIVLGTLELALANERVDRIRKMNQINIIQQQKENTRKQGTPVQIQPMK
jgi:hypothetical protein